MYLLGSFRIFRAFSGCNIDSWVLEKLMRRAWFYWQRRVGAPTWNMQFAFRGHMVLLAWEGIRGKPASRCPKLQPTR